MSSNWKNTALLILGVAVAFFAIGAWWSRGAGNSKTGPGSRRILYYHDPMHPAYRSDKPGIAPDCGMQLEPVYADGGPAETAGSESSLLAPGNVRVSADKQQLIGVRIEEVKKTSTEHHVRILGRVVADETRVYKVTAATDGVAREVSEVTTGSLVEKDQTLFSYYSKESLALRDQESFLRLAGIARSYGPGSESVSLDGKNVYAEFARDSLKLYGMSEAQVQELARTRKFSTTIRIISPVKGLVMTRNLSPEQRFEKGAELFRIADLSRVWVLADVFENDARLLESATGATVRYQDRNFPARVSSVPPQFDPTTRTLKLRLEVANPGNYLRPDMFADVDFTVRVPSAITLPVDAILDSGMRKTVFVDRGNGLFEPRKVETGARLGDRVVIPSGLMPGERVVVSGNFLIDSESRFKLAAAGMTAAATQDPVCGMDVEPAKARGGKIEHRGKTYYFCSESCRKNFEKDPNKYAGHGMER